jgi:hypothetical protein
MVRPQHFRSPAAMTMADAVAPSNDLTGPPQSVVRRRAPCEADLLSQFACQI